MHDSTPTHFSSVAGQYLNAVYPNCWIDQGGGRGGTKPWLQRSPKLNSLDFFLWGHLNSKKLQEIKWRASILPVERSPWNYTRSVLSLRLIPPEIIPGPSPNFTISCAGAAKWRSFGRRYARNPPSLRIRSWLVCKDYWSPISKLLLSAHFYLCGGNIYSINYLQPNLKIFSCGWRNNRKSFLNSGGFPLEILPDASFMSTNFSEAIAQRMNDRRADPNMSCNLPNSHSRQQQHEQLISLYHFDITGVKLNKSL